MKAKAWLCLVVVAALMAGQPALAGPRDQRLHRFLQERQQERQQQRELRREERQEFLGHGRLSPEERRQLRRDIHDAGQDVYRREPPPPPSPQQRPF
jgi:hypothetical protein